MVTPGKPDGTDFTLEICTFAAGLGSPPDCLEVLYRLALNMELRAEIVYCDPTRITLLRLPDYLNPNQCRLGKHHCRSRSIFATSNNGSVCTVENLPDPPSSDFPGIYTSKEFFAAYDNP